MNWQAFWISMYLIATMSIGIYASKKVKNAKDFILAGRSLPLPISTAALFATWFGSETILGSSVEFATKGFLGVIQDPLGASLCLLLLGIFFAKPLYKLKILTFGDFYRIKFGSKMEFLSAICLVFSYFGWVGAQFVALGIIFQMIFGLPQWIGILLGSGLVVFYTYLGGMWSVSLTDFVQSISIVIGLLVATIHILSDIPMQAILIRAESKHFQITPEPSYSGWVTYLSAWIVVGLGSIPQQDLFQRVMSAKSESVAKRAAFLSSILYLFFSLFPLFLGLVAIQQFPDIIEDSENSQLLLPYLIQNRMPDWIQILFFSGLTSAILSSASGAILAPSTILSENLLKPLFKIDLLVLSRICVLLISFISLGFALWKPSIYELVEDSSGLSLVTLFIPLVFGLFGNKTSENAAILSLVVGFTSWVLLQIFHEENTSHFYGTILSLFALLIGRRFFPIKPNLDDYARSISHSKT